MSIIEMGLSASLIIIVSVIIRALALNRLPSKTFLSLWGAAVCRLLIPLSIPAKISFLTLIEYIGQQLARNTLPTIQENLLTAPTQAQYGHTFGIPQAFAVPEAAETAANAFFQSISLWHMVWFAGTLIFVTFFAVSYFRWRKKFLDFDLVENDIINGWQMFHKLRRHVQIRVSDKISAPLTYGIFRPVVLLPKNMDLTDERVLKHVMTHEYVHIKRFDALTKLIVTAALCVHWFNPFVWVMYILFNRDIEISCDERVIKTLGEALKSSYAMTLIGMEEKKCRLSPLHSGFSKFAIEERIYAIMKTKKTSVLGIFLAIVLVAGTVTVFATSGSGTDVLSKTTKTAAPTKDVELETQDDSENEESLYREAVRTIAAKTLVNLDSAADSKWSETNGLFYEGEFFSENGLFIGGEFTLSANNVRDLSIKYKNQGSFDYCISLYQKDQSGTWTEKSSGSMSPDDHDHETGCVTNGVLLAGADYRIIVVNPEGLEIRGTLRVELLPVDISNCSKLPDSSGGIAASNAAKSNPDTPAAPYSASEQGFKNNWEYLHELGLLEYDDDDAHQPLYRFNGKCVKLIYDPDVWKGVDYTGVAWWDGAYDFGETTGVRVLRDVDSNRVTELMELTTGEIEYIHQVMGPDPAVMDGKYPISYDGPPILVPTSEYAPAEHAEYSEYQGETNTSLMPIDLTLTPADTTVIDCIIKSDYSAVYLDDSMSLRMKKDGIVQVSNDKGITWTDQSTDSIPAEDFAGWLLSNDPIPGYSMKEMQVRLSTGASVKHTSFADGREMYFVIDNSGVQIELVQPEKLSSILVDGKRMMITSVQTSPFIVSGNMLNSFYELLTSSNVVTKTEAVQYLSEITQMLNNNSTHFRIAD